MPKPRSLRSREDAVAAKAKLKRRIAGGGADDGLRLDPKNANRGTVRGAQMVEASLEAFGAGRSALASAEGVVIAGNKTVTAARKRKVPIRVVETDGTELIVVKRTDLPYDDPRAQGLAVADNRAAEVGLEWDPVVLRAVDVDVVAPFFSVPEIRALETPRLELPETSRADRDERRYADEGRVSPGDLDDDTMTPLKDPRVRRTSTSEEATADLDIDNPSAEDGDDGEDDRPEGAEADRESIYALREDALFPGDNVWGIPDLLPDRLATAIPNRTWTATGEENEERGCRRMVMVYGTNQLPADCTGATLAFYLDDWRFEAVWNDAVDVAAKLKGKGFAAVIAPDFSVWRDDPPAVQIFNIYRSRWCARYWQELGMPIVPSLNWSSEGSYEFAFAGIPVGAPVVSVQCRTTKSRRGKAYFLKGLVTGIEATEPGSVLLYGGATHREWMEKYLPKSTKGGPVKYVWLVDFTTARKRRLKELRDAKKLGVGNA